MQLFAAQKSGEVVPAVHAVSQHNYFCLECRGIVRLRGGLHRQRHFYHLQLSPTCRLSQKSMEHLQTQLYLQRLIGESACQLEVPYPQIGRIADVVWAEERLVFEVQCSPIPAAEVAARNRDYASLGLEVVWLLHTKTFGRECVAPAELLLRRRPCYFTSMNSKGEGGIFDRFDVIQNGVRAHVLDNLLVDVQSPKRCKRTTPLSCTRQRLEDLALYFAGDLVDMALSQPDGEYIQRARQIEQSQRKSRWSWHQWFVRPYQIVFRHVLESVSR